MELKYIIAWMVSLLFITGALYWIASFVFFRFFKKNSPRPAKSAAVPEPPAHKTVMAVSQSTFQKPPVVAAVKTNAGGGEEFVPVYQHTQAPSENYQPNRRNKYTVLNNKMGRDSQLYAAFYTPPERRF